MQLEMNIFLEATFTSQMLHEILSSMQNVMIFLAYMVKLIFHYQHKNVAGQNRLELHNTLDHILFRWRRGKYLISAQNDIEQNK